MNDTQFLAAIARALSGLGVDWNSAHALEIIADAVAIQAENHREAIDELRSQPQTQSEAA